MRFRLPCRFLPLFYLVFYLSAAPAQEEPIRWTVAERVEVDQAWAGHPVGFALLTRAPWQFVAYYDADRQMTVAMRRLDSDQWQFAKLGTHVGWDSHNYVTMALDRLDRLHVSGNMHCRPLIYFRSEKPLDVESRRPVASLVGSREDRCTYPRFLTDNEDDLLFTYRDGSSGRGDQIFDRYDAESDQWSRLMDEPLFSGQGKMNAYFHGPVRGPDSRFHICWVWRDTPDCNTNHHLSYARSENLIDWQTSDGRPLTLPITIETAECVDPVPPGGGMINGNAILGFDDRQRPIVTYHKYDADGNTQVYNARREADGWKIYQTSDWHHRWEFGGGGTIRFEVSLGPVRVDAQGRLRQEFSSRVGGGERWYLDPETLRPTGPAPGLEKMPGELGRLESTQPDMHVRTCGDSGEPPESGVRYRLRWEARGSNRDRQPEGPIPPPSRLSVWKLTAPPDQP